MEMLERRVSLLGVLRVALARARRVRPHRQRERGAGAAVAVAWSPPATACRPRPLGTVSVIGPVRMDYAAAIGSVREAAAPAVALRRGRLRGTATA